VLECVTLAQVVEFVVKVFVDLACGTILDEETAENSKTAHPNDLAIRISEPVLHLHPSLNVFVPWHTGISRTLPLTETTVSTQSSSGGEFAGAGSGVHGDGLADDEAICNELADGLARVGIGDLAGLVGIKPDLALSTAYDGCRKALLGGEVDPIVRKESVR